MKGVYKKEEERGDQEIVKKGQREGKCHERKREKRKKNR